MSATTTSRQRPQVPGTVFGRALAAEVAKIVTLRGWWVGAAVLLALTALFAVLNTGLLLEQIGTLAPEATFTDHDGSAVSVERAVLDAVLAPAYQSAAFFLPVAVALTAGQDYRHRQVLVSALAVPSRTMLFAAKLAAVVIASAGLCLLGCLLGDVVLLVMLPARFDAIVLSSAGLAVPLRIAVYGVAVGVLAAALTAILRSTLFALIAVVALFLVTATGVLAAFAPAAHQALPIIGAQTFLFGYPVVAGAPGRGAGVLILLAWALVPAAAWGITFVRRDLA